MKKSIILALILFALVSCRQNKEASSEQNVENLTEITLNVQGMTCTGCENAIVKSIEQLEGIGSASASYTEKIAVIKYDAGKTSIEEISSAISNAGYEVVDNKASEGQLPKE